MPSFTNYKDVIRAKFKKNGARDSDHAPFMDGLLSLSYRII